MVLLCAVFIQQSFVLIRVCQKTVNEPETVLPTSAKLCSSVMLATYCKEILSSPVSRIDPGQILDLSVRVSI